MSGYLLDTHVLLWWLAEPERLSEAARGVVRDPAHGVFFSAGAVWEMAIKKALGRLDYPANLTEVLAEERIAVLPIQATHALAIAELPLLHQDPFDRIQIAQAKLEGLTLVTQDERVKEYGIPVLAA